MAAHREGQTFASRFLCFAVVLPFFSFCSLPVRGLIADIYEDHTIPFQNETLQINHTVNVHANATLTIEPGVNIVFSVNGSLAVHGNLVANGTETSPIHFIAEIDRNSNYSRTHSLATWTLRLVDGNGYNTGRLEVFHEGIWGTVCDDGWTQRNSIVACRELGFASGTFTRQFGAGTGRIWMDNVNCRESDHSLKLCQHRGFGSHNCGKFYLIYFPVKMPNLHCTC